MWYNILVIRSLSNKDLQESTVNRVLSIILDTKQKYGAEASEQKVEELMHIVDSINTDQELAKKLDQM